MLVTPSAANVWSNLSTLSSITGSLVVTNTTAGDLFFYVGSSAPADSVGILCRQDEEVYLDNRTVDNSVWMKSDCIGPVIVQSESEASTEVRCLASGSTENTHTQATSLVCKRLDVLSKLINVM